jgi:hypothetical protein
MTPLFTPPVVPVDQAWSVLARQGYAVLDAAGAGALLGLSAADLVALSPAWDELPPDRFLKDGGSYRFRRHASGGTAAAPGTLAAGVVQRLAWRHASLV